MNRGELLALLELAARVEAATGPDREIDAGVWWRVFGSHADTDADLRPQFEADPAKAMDRWCGKGWRTELTWAFPARYTASLDAAMTLVPKGWFWMAGNRDRLTPRAYVENGKAAFVGAGTRRNPERLWFEVTAATSALALTAAALRARAAATNGDDRFDPETGTLRPGIIDLDRKDQSQ